MIKNGPPIPTTKTKRPKWVFLSALWVYYQSAFFIGIPLNLVKNSFRIPANILEFIHALLGWVIIILLVFCFINLRKISIKVVVGLLLIATGFLTYGLFGGINISGQTVPHTTRSYAVYGGMIVINLLNICLLCNKKFWVVVDKYRNEIEIFKKKEKKSLIRNST